MRLFLFLFLVCLHMLTMNGQTYQGLDAVKFVNAIDGDTVVLDYKTSGPLITLVFTSNYCPYSRRYDERLNTLYQEYSKRDVQFIMVNPNTGPDDSLEEMRKKATEQEYKFPYLKDPDQVLTNILGASRTPETYLLKPIDNGFTLVYHGAIDDNPQSSNDVESSYLKSAIDNALNGKPPETSYVKVTGCIIKK